MVAVARALFGDVRCCCWTSRSRASRRRSLKSCSKPSTSSRSEIAMMIVDHHLDLALALSDRTVVLERGAVTWRGRQAACATI